MLDFSCFGDRSQKNGAICSFSVRDQVVQILKDKQVPEAPDLEPPWEVGQHYSDRSREMQSISSTIS